MRYEIHAGEYGYVVFDVATQTYFKARFHRYSQAQEWVDARRVRDALAVLAGAPRRPDDPRAHLRPMTERDYYGANEARIARITEAVIL